LYQFSLNNHNDNNDNASNSHVNFQIYYFPRNRHLYNNNYNDINDHYRCQYEKGGEEMDEENYFQNTTNYYYSQSNFIMNKEKNYPFSSTFNHIPSSSTTF